MPNNDNDDAPRLAAGAPRPRPAADAGASRPTPTSSRRAEGYSRRRVLAAGAGLCAAALAPGGPASIAASPEARRGKAHPDRLPPPIPREEYEARIARLQAAMRAKGWDGFFAEPGANLFYLTGIAWGRSERVHGVLIPREGPARMISPAFEVPRLKERMVLPGPIDAWEEDESPYRLIWEALAKTVAQRTPRLALAPDVRLFIASGLKAAEPGAVVGDGAALITPMRMKKSAREIALMKAAFAITFAAMRTAAARLEAGMTPADIGAIIDEETRRRGADPLFSLVQIGEASAYPHGSSRPQVLRPGDVVLFDCGARLHGYQSDISRTFVFGKADPEVRRVWEDARRAQEIAFAAAQIGTPCAAVDRAVRRYLETRGYGPGYRTPGLPHRTGHGIGLEGHEAPYFVGSDHTPLAAGMCLSDEPGIYLPGRFGVRLEDCLYMTADGPRWFTRPARAITAPFG